MTDWAASLIPVGTALVTGTLIWSGQAHSNRSASRREQEKRRDEFRVRRYEIERETLLALHDAVTKQASLSAEYANASTDEERDRAIQGMGETNYPLYMLASRCLSRDAANGVIAFAAACTGFVENQASGPLPADEFMTAVRLIGEALQRDPFE